jgi:hypothetical protein
MVSGTVTAIGAITDSTLLIITISVMVTDMEDMVRVMSDLPNRCRTWRIRPRIRFRWIWRTILDVDCGRTRQMVVIAVTMTSLLI